MEKLKKVGKFVYKGLACIGGGVAAVSVAGVDIIGSQYAVAFSGAIAVFSAISSAVKDKNAKPIATLLMKLINMFAVNFDKAENDKKVNGVKKKKLK